MTYKSNFRLWIATPFRSSLIPIVRSLLFYRCVVAIVFHFICGSQPNHSLSFSIFGFYRCCASVQRQLQTKKNGSAYIPVQCTNSTVYSIEQNTIGKTMQNHSRNELNGNFRYTWIYVRKCVRERVCVCTVYCVCTSLLDSLFLLYSSAAFFGLYFVFLGLKIDSIALTHARTHIWKFDIDQLFKEMK